MGKKTLFTLSSLLFAVVWMCDPPSRTFLTEKTAIEGHHNADPSTEIYVVVVNYTGGPISCDNCSSSSSSPSPSPTPDLSISSNTFYYTLDYACGSGDSNWTVGDWSNGEAVFFDPTPSDSEVVGVTVEIWGTWNLQVQSKGVVFLNDVYVGLWESGPSFLSPPSCPNCPTPLSVPSCQSQAGWPVYFYDDVNTIKLIPKRNERVCVSAVVVSLSVVVGAPNISQLLPPIGPADAPTVVAIYSESSLQDATSLRCRFGVNVVDAVLLTPFKALCKTPEGNASEATPVSVSEDGKHYSDYLTFFYYEQPNLDAIEPAHGPANGGTVVTITGYPFLNVSSYFCGPSVSCGQCVWVLNTTAFSNSSDSDGTVTSPATYIDEVSISCVAPPLVKLLPSLPDNLHSKYQVTVYVYYTQNAQVSTGAPVEFLYIVKAPRWSQYVIFASVLCAIAVAVGFVMYFLSKWQPSQEMSGVDEHSALIADSYYHDDHIDPSSIYLLEVIGRGSVSVIHKAEWCGTQVAVKTLSLSARMNVQERIDLHKEVSIMRNMRHPNVLQYLGMAIPRPGEDDLWLVMEYMCRGSLFSFLHSENEISLQTKVRICRETAMGMLYLHSRDPPIIHRDLKSLNLLLDQNCKVKVCDFGLSTTLKQQKMKSCGTPAWSAPEVLRGNSYSTNADVYSFGVVIWEVITRRIPFEGLTAEEIFRRVLSRCERPSVDPSVEFCVLCPIMKRCWDEEAGRRPSFTTILDELKGVCE